MRILKEIEDWRLRTEKAHIALRGLRFHAFHGVMPQEGRVGGDFMVSLRVGYPLQRALESDDVADTLDYGVLYDLVASEMRQPSRLLEHVAGRIARAVEERFPQVLSIDLTVRKLNPPMGADCEGAEVEIHLINDKTN